MKVSLDKIFSTFLLFLFSVISHGQDSTSLAIGHWRAYLPYQYGKQVSIGQDNIFYSTGFSVLMLDKLDLSPSFFSEVEGLSNTGIRTIKYNKGAKVLIIAYENSVIDLVGFSTADGKEASFPQYIETLTQINNFRNFVGQKIINDIFVANDSVVLLSANYGLSALNINRAEFSFTVFTGMEVKQSALWNGSIYIATEEGIFRSLINNSNIGDFSTWQWLGQEQGLPAGYQSSVVAPFAGKLYFGVNDTLYFFEAEKGQKIHYEPGQRLFYLNPGSNILLAGYRCVPNDCLPNKVAYFRPDNSLGYISADCVGIPIFAEQDEQGRVWFCDEYRQIRVSEQPEAPGCNFLTFNSPYSEKGWKLALFEDQLWLASGGVTPAYGYTFTPDGFASLKQGNWIIYNRDTREEIKGEDKSPAGQGPVDDLQDFIAIAVNPSTGKVYAGSFLEGLIEVDGDKLTLFNEKNSSLGNAVGDSKRTRISGLVFDAENNLWISNHLATKPLSVLKSDGSWQSFSPSCGVTELFESAIDGSGYLWFTTSTSQEGLVVFDPGDLANGADDRCRLFSTLNSELPTNNVNCIARDLEGDIWVGTDQGIIVFECRDRAFDPACLGRKPFAELDGFGANLGEDLEVISIAIDGANRKWLGTRNGIFVLSADGRELIIKFDNQNYPLFDDNILDIAVHPVSGEVFIVTGKGLVSYRSDATEGGKFHEPEIEVFPNPVRPEYTGPIAIKGLARDANVKITDVNGKLVYETKAKGGQAIWYAADYNNRRVQSGVYLVFSTTNPSGLSFTAKPEAVVAKVVVIH